MARLQRRPQSEAKWSGVIYELSSSVWGVKCIIPLAQVLEQAMKRDACFDRGQTCSWTIGVPSIVCRTHPFVPSFLATLSPRSSKRIVQAASWPSLDRRCRGIKIDWSGESNLKIRWIPMAEIQLGYIRWFLAMTHDPCSACLPRWAEC